MLTWWRQPIPGQPPASPRSLGGGIAVSPVFVFDSFSGSAPAASLQSHVGEIGATWTKHPAYAAGGDIRLSTQGTAYSGTAPPPLAYYASGIPFGPNYSVFQRYRWESIGPSAFDGGPCGRMDTVANTMYLGWYNALNTRWELYRVNAGVLTLMGTFIQVVVIATNYEMELRMNGTAISIFIDGVLRIGPVADATIAGPGRVGMRQFSTVPGSDVAGIQLDNTRGVAL